MMGTKLSDFPYSALQNSDLASSALASSGALDYFLTGYGWIGGREGAHERSALDEPYRGVPMHVWSFLLI